MDSSAMPLRFRQIRRNFLTEPIANCKQRQKKPPTMLPEAVDDGDCIGHAHLTAARRAVWSAFSSTALGDESLLLVSWRHV